MKTKIIIICKPGHKPKCRANVDHNVALNNIEYIAASPYTRVKSMRRTAAKVRAVSLLHRLRFVFSAIRTAFSAEFKQADINRHQYEG